MVAMNSIFKRCTPETSHVMQAWEAFLGGEPLPRNALRPLILHSWQRSRSRQVDPQRRKAPLQQTRLEAEQRAHEELIQAAQPVLAETAEMLSSHGAIVLLCNHRGLILQSCGCRSTQEIAEEANIVPGGLWQEEVCGTNAVGTALAVRHSVQIHASEHFCEGVKSWTCAASLVHDPVDGRLLGAIDISYQKEALDGVVLPLVVSVARRVEGILDMRQTQRRNHLLEAYIDCLPQYQRDGVLLLEKTGRLLRHSERLPSILASRGIDAPLQEGSVLASADACGEYRREGLRYPEWIDPDWIRPVYIEGGAVGAIVHIPAPQTRSDGRPPQADTLTGNPFLDGHACPAMRRAVAEIQRVSRVDVPVLIEGETGTGKEIVARAIHDQGSRRGKPFIAVNCGAIPRELLASELFGHVEGAFTGARRGGAPGKFELADGGTLFLDELAELPLDLQPYLLRALEDHAITRLGSGAAKTVDARIVAATNRDLLEETQAGRFREDLYYRFRVNIKVPPLRERTQDIDRYLDAALAKVCANYGLEKCLSAPLRRILRTYHFPGNLRELNNIVEHMAVMTDATVLTPAHLPASAAERLAATAPADSPMPTDMRAAERQIIEQALARSAGNRSEAARRLGISRATLYRRLSEYGTPDGICESGPRTRQSAHDLYHASSERGWYP